MKAGTALTGARVERVQRAACTGCVRPHAAVKLQNGVCERESDENSTSVRYFVKLSVLFSLY